jgi:MFS family permease
LLSSLLTGFSYGVTQMCIPLLAKEELGASAFLLGVYGLAFNFLLVFVALGAERLRRAIGFRGCIALGALALAASSFGMFRVREAYLAIAPCLVWGISHALYYSAIVAANAEGQGAEQIKRGSVYFIVAAVLGQMVGFFGGGWLYETGRMMPFAVSGGLALLVFALSLLPGSMRIAPWRAGLPHRDERIPVARRRLFVRLSFLANFGLCVAVLSVFVLLPEYARARGMTGLRYGLLMSAVMLGSLMGYGTWVAWHGWHYSPRVLLGMQGMAAGAMLWFSFGRSYWELCGAMLIVGIVISLTYISSLYYGLELGGYHTGHGGRHEAVIGAAMGIGPFLGGCVIAASGWPRAAFPAAAAVIVGLMAAQGLMLARGSSRA